MFHDIYPQHLDTHGDVAAIKDCDYGVYRQFRTRLDVPGLPADVAVGGVRFWFVEGPVLSQRTEMRQRIGAPYVYDKVMHHAITIGDGSLLTVAHLKVPLTDGAQLERWSQQVHSAAGALTAVLDERVAGPVVGDDLILFRGDQAVSAADGVSRVRTFAPFGLEVRDRDALRKLSEIDVLAESPLATAAALYSQAAVEGPSRLGVLLHWLCVDGLVDLRAKKRQAEAVELAIQAAGLDASWLRYSVNQLADVRGDLAHGKPVSDEEVAVSYYDIEAVARGLLRHEMQIQEGWPRRPDRSAYPILSFRSRGYDEVWHEGQLPDIQPTGLIPEDRRDPMVGGHSDWLRIDGARSARDLRLVQLAAVEARQQLGIDTGTFLLEVKGNEDFDSNQDFGVSSERILLARRLLRTSRENIGATLCRAAVQQQLLRLGVPPTEVGEFVYEFLGTWFALQVWSAGQGTSEMEMPSSYAELGFCAAFAHAGDEHMATLVDAWREASHPEVVQFIDGVAEDVVGADNFAEATARLAARFAEVVATYGAELDE